MIHSPCMWHELFTLHCKQNIPLSRRYHWHRSIYLVNLSDKQNVPLSCECHCHCHDVPDKRNVPLSCHAEVVVGVLVDFTIEW